MTSGPRSVLGPSSTIDPSIVGGASIACVVSHRCPIFMVFGIM